MTRIKTALLVVLALVIAAASGGVVGAGAAIALVRNAYNGPVESERVAELLVNSDELGEPMLLGVRLPLEYDSNPQRRFPVLWVLDGPSQGPLVARTTEALSRIGLAEPSIVIEVPSSSRGRATDFTPPRERDSNGARADQFLRFLATEAMPAVAEAYRVDSVRVVVGHSLGGLFALYSLAEQPSVFDGYFVFSPAVWVDDEAIIGDVQRALQSRDPPSGTVYLSLGEQEGNRMLRGFDAVRVALESSPDAPLEWRADITPDADHGSNPRLSVPVAARWYWGR